MLMVAAATVAGACPLSPLYVTLRRRRRLNMTPVSLIFRAFAPSVAVTFSNHMFFVYSVGVRDLASGSPATTEFPRAVVGAGLANVPP